MRTKNVLIILLCIFLAIIPCVVYGTAIVKSIQMSANCINYLEMSANANSVELAEKHLTTGIEYIEENNLTEGSTKIFIYRPTNDLGLWYDNLKSAQNQLNELKQQDELTELEESNALIKLRESLLDSGGYVIHPAMISFYPNHLCWIIVMWLIWLFWIAAFVIYCCKN